MFTMFSLFSLLIGILWIGAIPLAIFFGIVWRKQTVDNRSLRAFLTELYQEGRISEEEAWRVGCAYRRTWVNETAEPTAERAPGQTAGQPVEQAADQPAEQAAGQAAERAAGQTAERTAGQPSGQAAGPSSIREVDLMAPHAYRVHKPSVGSIAVERPAPVKNFDRPRTAEPVRTSSASPVSIVFVIGVFFIIMAGIIFATTTWHTQTAVGKVSLLLLASAVFFGASAIAQGKFKLRQTGAAFYSLGSIFLPVSILAIGFFQLFGRWFSIYGDGRWLLGALSSALLSVALFFGHRIYRRTGLDWCALFAAGFTVICIGLFLEPGVESAALTVTLYTAVLLIASELRFKQLASYLDCICWISAAAIVLAVLGALPAFVFVEGAEVLAVRISAAAAVMAAILAYKAVRHPEIQLYRNALPLYWMIFLTGIMRNLESGFNIDLNFIYSVLALSSLVACDFITCKGKALSEDQDGTLEEREVLHPLHPLKSVVGDVLYPLITAGIYLTALLSFEAGEWMLLGLSALPVISAAYLARERKPVRYVLPFLFPVLVFHLCFALHFYEILYVAVISFVCLLGFAAAAIMTDRYQYVSNLKAPLVIAVNICGGLFTGVFVDGYSGKGFFVFAVGVAILWTLLSYKEKNSVSFYAAAGMWPVSAMLFCAAVVPDMDYRWLWFVAAAFMILYVMPRLVAKKILPEEVERRLYEISIVGISFISLFALVTFLQILPRWDFGGVILYGLLALLITAFGYALWHRAGMTVFMIFHTGLAYWAAVCLSTYIWEIQTGRMVSMLASNVIWVILCLIFLGAGGVCHKMIYERKEKQISLDCLTIAAVLSPLALISALTAEWRFAGWLLLAVYVWRFVNRVPAKLNGAAKFISVAALYLAFYSQPFVEIPELVALKINLLIPLALWPLCTKQIWKEKKDWIGWVAFGYSVFAAYQFLLEALMRYDIFDALFVGILSLGILLAALHRKSKRWFLLSACTLALIGFYLSRSFWLSLTWWFYLLLTGCALIGVACANEVYRKKGIRLSGKLRSVFDEWEW